MRGESTGERPPVSRRTVLTAAAGVGAGLTSGCVGALNSLIGASGPAQLSLSVKTVPADTDPVMTRIARRLVDNLKQLGVDVHVQLEPRVQLRQDVLMNDEYDIYVGQFPGHADPDLMRPLLHSVFATEAGWQNPVNYADLSVDNHLSDQRQTAGNERQLAVGDLQRAVARKQPVGVVAFPKEIWTARSDRFVGWSEFPPTDPLCYVRLERPEGGDRDGRLRVTTTDGTPTENLNPLSAMHRYRGTFTGLLYDSLGRRYDGRVNPWLAEEWSFDREDGETTATVALRSDLRFHDGRSLTASDVAFTYRFLNDTTLENGEAPVPAPRLRGRASLVQSVAVRDPRTVELQFGATSPVVARRALTVPVLPAHVWESMTAQASAAGLDMSPYPTEAIVTANAKPVGSGVLQFEESTSGESLVLTRFEDHFIHSNPVADPTQRFDGGVPFRRLSVRIVPSDAAGVKLVGADEADATATSISPTSVSRVGEHDGLTLYTEDARTFYHVGFNTQRWPFGNGHFRRLVMRLLDKEVVTDEVMGGYGRPGVTPMTGTDWVPADLTWSGEEPAVPFIGDHGELDVERARNLFRQAGFEFDDAGRLIAR